MFSLFVRIFFFVFPFLENTTFEPSFTSIEPGSSTIKEVTHLNIETPNITKQTTTTPDTTTEGTTNIFTEIGNFFEGIWDWLTSWW